MLHREVTARLEAWRLLLFIICLENQGNDSSNEHAELKNPFPCNIHTCHELRSDCHRQSFYFYSLRDAPPHSFTIGGKKKYNHPRKKIEGNRLPGYYRQHRKQHITRFDRLQGKLRSESCESTTYSKMPRRRSICAAGASLLLFHQIGQRHAV